MIFGMFIFECSECQLVTTFCLALCNISFVEGWKASQIMVLDVLPDGARERRHGTPERERERLKEKPPKTGRTCGSFPT